MASTFSNLGIILQASGENSGTWGDRTNVNLQRIDNAITGISNIVVTGATTLAFMSLRNLVASFSLPSKRAGLAPWPMP